MDIPRTRTEIIELFQLHASVPTNQRTFRTRNRHEKSACRCRLKFVIPHRATETVGAPLERCRNADEKKDPRVFFICTKGGRGGAGPDPHTCRSRNPPLGPAPIFWPNFLGKILEIKIVLLASPRRGRYPSSRSDSAAIGQRSWHRWSLSSSRPTPQRLLPRPPAPLRIYSARRVSLILILVRTVAPSPW